jgi:MFS family permease
MRPIQPAAVGKTRSLTLALGVNQLIAWGTVFYVPAVIVGAAAADLGISQAAVVGGFSWALLLAGFCAPRIGRRIDRIGGRGVLALSTVVMAAGLALLAAAHEAWLWYGAWSVLGIGMALGLYDAAFATAGRLLGDAASPVITGATLLGGFASTIGWPAGAALVAWCGWRGMLLIYAGLQLGLNLPLVLLAVPVAGPPVTHAAPAAASDDNGRVRTRTVTLLASFFTLRWFVSSAVAVYVLPIFHGIGLSTRQAVIVAAMIGPSQVAGRILEWRVGHRLNILTRARLGAALFPIGVIALAVIGAGAAPVFALLYGMSNGILTINRGTLPMALFGPRGYAALLGWLAVPVLLAQATAPTLSAPLMRILPPLTIVAMAGAIGAVAALLLLPLRLPPHGTATD